MPQTTIQEIRQRYPQYDDLSDEELAEGLYRKHYSDMPRGEFDRRIGLVSAENPAPGAELAPPIDPAGANVPWYEQGRKPEPPAAPGGLERAAKIGVQGVGRGLAEAPVLPLPFPPYVAPGPGAVDIMSAIVNGLSYAAEEGINLFLPDQSEVDLPRAEEPVGGSRQVREGVAGVVERAGVPLVDPGSMSFPERTAYNTNRFGTEAAAGGAGLAANSMNRAGQGVTRPDHLEGLRAPYREAPAKSVAADTMAGAGAGASLSTAEEYVPEEYQGPLTDLLAILAGGAGGGTLTSLAQSGARGAGEAARRVAKGPFDTAVPADPVTGLPVPEKTARRAAKTYQGFASEPQSAQEMIARRRAEAEQEGLPTPSSGIASGDIGLMLLENRMRQLPESQRQFIERDTQLREAASREAESARPAGVEPDQRRMQRFAEETAGEMRDRAQTGIDQAQTDLDAARRRLGEIEQQASNTAAPVVAQRGVGPVASTELSGEVVDRTLRPRAAENRRLTEAAGETDLTTPADSLVESASSIRSEIGKLTPAAREALPAEFVNRLDEIVPKTESASTGLLDEAGQPITREVSTGGTGEVDVKSLLEVRPYLATAARNAQDAGNFRLADNIRAFKSAVNDELDAVIARGEPGSEAVAEAQRYFREEYAPFFAEGQGALFRERVFQDSKAVKGDEATRVGLPPSEVAGFFLTGPAERAAHLRRIIDIAPDPEAARGAVQRFMEADLATKVDANGRLNPQVVRTWLDNRKQLWEAFPEVGQRFERLHNDLLNNRAQQDELKQQIDRLAENLRSAGRDAREVDRTINKSVLSTFIDKSPDKAARSVLNAQDPARAVGEVNDLIAAAPASVRQGLRDEWQATVTDHLVDLVRSTRETPGGEDVLNYSALVKTLRKYDPLLEQVYKGSPEKLQALRRAQKILSPLANRELRSTTGSPTAERMTIGSERAWNTLEAGLKAYYGVLKGGGVLRVLRIAARNLPDDTEMVGRLIERAHFDPDVAQHLLTKNAEEAGTAAWNRKLLRLLGLGEAARDIQETDDAEATAGSRQ